MAQQLHRELARLDVKRGLLGQHLRFVRRFARVFRDRMFMCTSAGKRYNRIGRRSITYGRVIAVESLDHQAPKEAGVHHQNTLRESASAPVLCLSPDVADDPDLVSIKVILLGDCHTGKTSFMAKYAGDGAMEEPHGLQMSGLGLMDKIVCVPGARITFNIWDVAGDRKFRNHVPVACKDASAVVIIFDLTSRCTLNNAMSWYHRARRCNEDAIPVLVGTKFDEFVQLPMDLQWTIVNQARAVARAMGAALFFSSTTYDINVNKVFKFIAAKIFQLPWSVERNLTLGEPTIDF